MTVASGRAIERSQRWSKDGNNVSETKEQDQQCFFYIFMLQIVLSITLEKGILQWLSHNQTSHKSNLFQAVSDFLAWGSMALRWHGLLHVMSLPLCWFSQVPELYFFLFAFEPMPPALCVRPTTERFITGQGHVSAGVAGSPEFTFLSSHMSFLSWHGKSN